MSTPDIVYLDDWTPLALTGAEVQPFLDRLLTINVPAPDDARMVVAALLNPQGKIQHQLFITSDGKGAYTLHVHVDYAPALLKRLTMLKLRAAVTIAPLEEQRVGVALEPVDGFMKDPRGASPCFRGVVDRNRATATDRTAYDSWRVDHFIADQGLDFGFEERWPSDLNMDLQQGVDRHKGCFIGQEVVSRMLRKGGVRKRLCRLEADAALAPGAVQDATGAGLGDATTALGNRALAVLRVDRLGADGASLNGVPVRIALPEGAAP